MLQFNKKWPLQTVVILLPFITRISRLIVKAFKNCLEPCSNAIVPMHMHFKFKINQL